jgi:nitronate monooxygenase
MGTRFVATHECDADPAFKQAFVDAKEEDIVVIKSPVGLPGRAIRNEFIDRVIQGETKPFKCPYHCIKTCDHTKSPYCIAIALGSAKKGRLKTGFAFAGKNVFRVDKIVSVKELIQSLWSDYAKALSA